MPCLMITAILAIEVGGLSLTINSQQKEVLVGEPVKISVTWEGHAIVKNVAVEEPDFLFQSLALAVEEGKERSIYRESARGMPEMILLRRTLKAGERKVVDLVFLHGLLLTPDQMHSRSAFLFPKAGEYVVRAVYLDAGVPTDVVSNPLRFRVVEPHGSDRVVWGQIQREPNLLKLYGSADTRSHPRRLLDQYPSSPYLRFTWLEDFASRGRALGSQQDPDTGESFWDLGREGRREFARQYYRRMLEELLAIPDWGPFEPEALAIAFQYALAAGDKESSERFRKELITKYPDSAMGRRYRRSGDEPEPVPAAKQPSAHPRP